MNKDTAQKTVFGGFLEALRKDPELGPKLEAMEKQDEEVKRCTPFVDLDIEFSPVIMAGGTSTRDAVPVAYKGSDGRYVIEKPFRIVTADELKVMRARYLVIRGEEMEPALRRAFGGKSP